MEEHLLTPAEYLRLKATHAAILLRCKAEALHALDVGDSWQTGGAVDIYRRKYPGSPFLSMVERQQTKLITRASVPAGGPGSWGDDLLPSELQEAIIDFAQPFSILGRFPGVPAQFRLPCPPLDTDAVTAHWVGAGAAVPVVKRTFASAVVLEERKSAGTIVLSNELVRRGSPKSDALMRDLLAASIARFQDSQFVDPTKGLEADSPASITHGLTPLVSTGEPTSDLKQLVAAYVVGGGKLASAVFVLSSKTAVAMKLWDSVAFATLTRDGGTLLGIPALCSDSVGNIIILADSARVLIADDKKVTVEMSTHSTLEMDDAPVSTAISASSPMDVVASAQTSLWQAGLLAIKAERYANWRALPGAVQYVESVAYLTTGSPSL